MHTESHRFSHSIRAKLGPFVLAAAACAAVFAAGAPSSAHADDGLKKYAGNYKYAKDAAHGQAIIDKAVDEALSQLNTVMKMMAKKAMEATGRGPKFSETILIELPSDQVGIQIGEHEKVVLKKDKPTKMTRDGRTGTVTIRFKGGQLLQTLEGEDGKITNRFTLDKDGKTLHRDVKIEGERLQKPIKFRLTYVRS